VARPEVPLVVDPALLPNYQRVYQQKVLRALLTLC